MVKSTKIKIEDVMGKKNEPFSPSMRMSPRQTPKRNAKFRSKKNSSSNQEEDDPTEHEVAC